METLRDKIGRWLPFAFWVFMTAMMVITLIVSISLAVARLAVFGIIGSGISIVIYAIQSVGEWQEAKMPSE